MKQSVISLTDVFMIHMPQKLDLPKRPLRIDFIIERISYFFERYVLVRLRIQSRANNETEF